MRAFLIASVAAAAVAGAIMAAALPVSTQAAKPQKVTIDAQGFGMSFKIDGEPVVARKGARLDKIEMHNFDPDWAYHNALVEEFKRSGK
jgi:hypothetical protein